MPRKQVYGKKARQVYDPFAAFASPSNDRQEIGILEGKVREGRRSAEEVRWKMRNALSEKNANMVMNLRVPTPQEARARRPRGRKVGGEVSKGGLSDGGERSGKTDDIDDTPLFIDGHGYDDSSDDNNAVTTPVKQPEATQPPTVPQIVSLPDTPSINILPSTPTAPDEYSQHTASLLDLSSHPLTLFPEWSNQLSSHFSITKIAEASFGEVYRLSLLEQLAGFSSSDESVFKVIALQPPESFLPKDKRRRDAVLKKAEMMSKPEDVANEVRLLQRMSIIPGFTNFRDVRVVRGRPPPAFAKAFKEWNARQKVRGKDQSHFPDPSKKTSYPDDQLWAVIEMQDAGTDLECMVESGGCSSSSVWVVWDVFWQVVLSLAKGEEGGEFEHRDLHLGNICVRGAAPDLVVDPKRKLNFTGLETTVIDYTISRALLQDDKTVAFHDLAQDAGIFEGDSTEEYQYDIYRYMRGAVLADDAYAESCPDARERDWEQYHPVTNLIWLHFILYKLLEQLDWPSATKAPPARKQKPKHVEWKRANDLEFVLLRVQELLDPGEICAGELRSAGDLVGLALEEGWIDVGDVVGDGGCSELVEDMEKLELESQPVQEVGPGAETVVSQTRSKR